MSAKTDVLDGSRQSLAAMCGVAKLYCAGSRMMTDAFVAAMRQR